MKSWILLIVIVVAISTAATVAVPFLTADSAKIAAPSALPEGPAPSLTVDEALSHDFGHMAQDSEGKHSWHFHNGGPGVLEIRNLGTDCSCTIAQLGKDDKSVVQIKPGQSEPIELTWNTRKTDGPYRKAAKIGTNDPAKPEVVLTVEGNVRPAVATFPSDPAINFQAVGNEKPHTYQVALFSGDRPDLKLTRMVSSNPALIGLESRPMTKEECETFKVPAGHSVTVTLKPTPNLGPFAEEILLETDHPLRREIKVTVLGRVEGPIVMTPSRVLLHDVSSRSGGAEDLTIWVRGQGQTKFTVARKPKGLEVAIAPVAGPEKGKNASYRMTVKVLPGTPSGMISDEIVLKTDHPMASEVKVPVDVLVQSAD
jgi:hypothetical protein